MVSGRRSPVWALGVKRHGVTLGSWLVAVLLVVNLLSIREVLAAGAELRASSLPRRHQLATATFAT